MVLYRFVFLRCAPAHERERAVLGADRVAPCERVVDLDEVVVPQDRVGGLDAAEEVRHSLFEFCVELGHGARGVDFGEREAEFVFETPETREEDGAGEEVVLSVGLLVHEGQVVLDQARAGGHWVFEEGALGGVEGFLGEEVGDARGGFLEERWVALGEVGAANNL